jgi:hypothetical protein
MATNLCGMWGYYLILLQITTHVNVNKILTHFHPEYYPKFTDIKLLSYHPITIVALQHYFN